MEDCSWLYWCKYHLNLPEKVNDGALKGSVCHTILEVLLRKKHKKHLNAIYKLLDIEASEPIKRLTIKHLNKVGSCPPHYWSIASANGPTSAGTCSKCGATKRFDNSLNTGGGWFLQMADEKATKENQEIKELEKLVT